MSRNKTAPNDAANVTRGLTDAPDSSRRPAMPQPTERPGPASQLALIRSITGHAVEGDEASVLAEVQAVLNGADVTDLLRARMGGG